MDIDYKAIGKRIKVKRIQLDMKQETLAEMADLSLSHMSNIETGRTKLSLPVIIILANALNTTVDELLQDNVVYSQNIIEKEVQVILNDCTGYEKRILVELMKRTKESLRKNQKFLESEKN